MKKILLTLSVFVSTVGVGILAFNRAISPASKSVLDRPVESNREPVPAGGDRY
jgi:hypothetical protein